MAERGNDGHLERPRFESKPMLLIVAAPYQKRYVDWLCQGAAAALGGVAEHERIDVPGALEIPPAIRIASASDRYDGFVALGCVVRGDTTHYEIVCAESARGITLLGLSGLCIGNGIITVEDEDQARSRADPAMMNKGGEAALAALHLIALARRFGARQGQLGFNLRLSAAEQSSSN